MKLYDWQERFALRILRRGEDYYASGAVDSSTGTARPFRRPYTAPLDVAFSEKESPEAAKRGLRE